MACREPPGHRDRNHRVEVTTPSVDVGKALALQAQLLTALYAEQSAGGYEEVATKLSMPRGSIGPARARCLRKLMEIMDSMDQGG